MIKSITVINPNDEELVLELAKPDKSGLVVREVTGLGPGQATVNMSEIATLDGAIFNSARKPSRNIVIKLTYEWLDTIEESRLRVYKFFPLKKKVKLIIETDKRRGSIEGYVENNDPTIFSNQEGSDVSIMCPFPFFKSEGDNAITSTTFYGIEPLFEFPFENDSLTEPLLEMGEITQRTEATIMYYGDADTGLTIIIHALGDVSNLTIYDLDTRESMRLDDDRLVELTGNHIIAQDEITICTEAGKKSVTLLREGNRYNILNCLGPHPAWFKVQSGLNRFAYTLDDGLLNMEFRMENVTLYEGM